MPASCLTPSANTYSAGGRVLPGLTMPYLTLPYPTLRRQYPGIERLMTVITVFCKVLYCNYESFPGVRRASTRRQVLPLTRVPVYQHIIISIDTTCCVNGIASSVPFPGHSDSEDIACDRCKMLSELRVFLFYIYTSLFLF